MIEKIVLGFGSNVGSRLKNINAAVKGISLTKGFDILALSSVYETEPWGFKKQPKFLNCAGVFLCRVSPYGLPALIRRTEKKIGRVNRGKWQAREIDIDVLFYGARCIKNKNLIIPHPFIQERNFVLKPLVDLIPGFIHPVFRKSINYLYLNSKDKSKLRLYKETI